VNKGKYNPNYKHGGTGTSLYRIWVSMMQRCFNENSKDYPRYGGRDIYVIPEWFDFVTFREWALANGYKAGLCIHRKDNDDYYSPENCEFVVNGRHVSQHNKVKEKPVNQYDLSGNFIATYPSISEAGRNVGVNRANIVSTCQGRIGFTGGFKWRYTSG